MASSLIRLASKIHAVQLPYASKLLTDQSSLNSGCRSLMTLVINTESELRDVLPPMRESYQFPFKNKLGPLDPVVLKGKEKGDWKCLTMEEKKALYQMSMNQSITDAAPIDEWKKILAGTFFAMGLMTIGIYVWFTQFVWHEIDTGSMQSKKSLTESVNSNVLDFILSDKVESTFDSQARH